MSTWPPDRPLPPRPGRGAVLDAGEARAYGLVHEIAGGGAPVPLRR